MKIQLGIFARYLSRVKQKGKEVELLLGKLKVNPEHRLATTFLWTVPVVIVKFLSQLKGTEFQVCLWKPDLLRGP